MYSKIKYLFVALILLLGCDEIEQPSVNQFVVEAFITADAAVNDIRIKETLPLEIEELSNIPVTDAVITVTSGDEAIDLEYNNTTQKYVASSSDFPIVIGQEYGIEITAGGVTATANTIVPERPTGLTLTDSVLVVRPLTLNLLLREQIRTLFEEERIRLEWDSSPGRSYFVVIENKVSELDPILPEGIPAESTQLLSSFRFISEPSERTSFQIIAVALETYGRHVAKVFSVNEEYVDLFNSATQDSRDLNEPPSNVTNALGIFTAFAVDSVEFEVRRR